ncbi:hypothetical protein Tco_0774858 [Tanacetum coccineum]|uniref:Uncharacterized protein n=1 Tax=Tanacetum coccineum TaxID=301880 RepID=A0ABQ4ZQM1_9ASTR
MERANKDGFFAKKDKSHKRRRDDQDPIPLPDSNPSKKRIHASDASGSTQPPAPQSSAEKTSTLEKLLPAPPGKNKTRPNWLKPVPKEDRPTTPEPYWVIPLNELPETENN